MRYAHLLSAFAAEIWAMPPEKLHAIAEFLLFKADGGELSAEEIAARVAGSRAAATARKDGDVAILPLFGMISPRAALVENSSTGGGVSADDFGARFRSLINDDSIKAIVLDVHSPGGNVYGIEALANEIRASRGTKPIVAQVNSQAASGAYWIIAQADEIVVTPGGEAGSIGAYTVHEDVSARMAQMGVKPTLIKAGENKAELANFVPLSDDAKAALQERIDTYYRAFVKAVAMGRGVSAKDVEARMGQGRMFGAEELVKRGMADRIGTLRETVARLGGDVQPRASDRSRQAFAAGENPSLSVIEGVLREAGFPKTLAVEFVSHGKGAFRRGDPGAEANAEAFRAIREAAANFRPSRI